LNLATNSLIFYGKDKDSGEWESANELTIIERQATSFDFLRLSPARHLPTFSPGKVLVASNIRIRPDEQQLVTTVTNTNTENVWLHYQQSLALADNSAGPIDANAMALMADEEMNGVNSKNIWYIVDTKATNNQFGTIQS